MPFRAATSPTLLAIPALLGLLAAAPEPVGAREFSPRVLSPHNADAYSMKTFAEYSRWKDLRGDAKVIAIFEYLTDRRTGLYPMGAGAWEGNDPVYDFGYIRDPVKMINVYPLGYCDMLGPTAAGIFEAMGVGAARTVNLPGLHHVLAEVRINGRWAAVDLDLRAVFRKPDGTLASIEEARANPALWERPNGPRFFPMDDLEKMREAYARSPVEYRYGVQMGGHTMDFILRRGETFTRWWKPQGDRWNHHPSYHERLRSVLERPPPGPKCKHGDAYTIHTRGNGRLVYRPDLRAGSKDFADGVYDAENVRPDEDGLTLCEPGTGHAVFEVRTPYVIVPRVGRYETPNDDREASVIEVEGRGIRLDVSTDNGITYTELAEGAGTWDATRLVSARYGYLLRIGLRGAPGKAVLRALKITTWVELHPASLPSLRKGVNRMRYVTGDHYGLPTRVLEIRTNGSRREDFLKCLCEPPADFDPARFTQRAKGPFVARVAATPGTRIAWFCAGGAFCTYQGKAAARTRNSMSWAAEKPQNFQETYRSRIPADQAHWHTNADVEVRLAKPARVVFVRYVGDPGVNNLRIYAHCLEEKPRPATRAVITHAWTEGGKLKKHKVSLAGPGSYEITCEAEPADAWIEMSVPGGR